MFPPGVYGGIWHHGSGEMLFHCTMYCVPVYGWNYNKDWLHNHNNNNNTTVNNGWTWFNT